ncbi:MAG: trypsin-like peptidase domain-containing protein [Clostridia bacterium]|nr:trypsin-like peptidase domain-containing protein [Clostridia bacterium]
MKKRGRAIVAILSAALVFTAISGILPAFGAATQKEAISAETQYAAAGRSMLYIRCFYESGGLKTTGSGFIIDSDGLAVTAAHVIDKAARVTAIDSAGKELECTVVSSDMASDMAVLRLPRGSYKPLQLADKAASGGATLRAMGYPFKDTLVITEGLVASPCGTVNEKQRMLVSCNIVNGMSGGPVFDQYGKVVGVCSGSVRTMNGIHLSVLWNDLCAAVSAAKSGK